MISIVKIIIKQVRPLRYLYLNIDWIRTRYLLSTDIKAIPNQIFKKVFGRDINWENPTSLIEKIYWMQIYSDTSLWTRCSDKYLVRSYVIEKECEDVLNTLYGKWNNATDIDWNMLPESFVLKTNNSCGQVILVKDKKDLNIPQTIQKLNDWLNIKYGYRDAQLHYTKIKPCIIAEKLFENKIERGKSLVDYKIWCFNGVPECILVVYNRTNENYFLSSYDLKWKNISDKTFNLDNAHYSGTNISKPESFDQMIECAKKLSTGVPQVRIDFYDIDGKAIFGEMTFTTGFGYYKEEYYDYLGSMLDLKKVKKIEPPTKPFKSVFQ